MHAILRVDDSKVRESEVYKANDTVLHRCMHGAYVQGLKFRRNFAEIRRKISFSLLTGKKNFVIFRKISFENSKFKKIRPKVTEIRRNLPKFRNEISFPLNTGICNENEMVNPDWSVVPGLAANDHARKYK